MSYNNNSLNISKLSVIGAGQIGPDIMLHFAKVMAESNVNLVLVDITETALVNARKKIEKKIARGIENGTLKEKHAEQIKNSINYSNNYNDIINSDIVLESASENADIKDNIFKKVEKLSRENTIFLSNSSHMQPEIIFKSVKNKSRCMVSHYFFPADRNPVVELVPSDETDNQIFDNLFAFYKSIGKMPIKVKSSYGYAIDPIFEGLCQTAISMYEKGWGNEKQIDKVACETLGLGVGPFTALNLTGGNPITDHGLDNMGKFLMPWFKSPAALKEALQNNHPWRTAGKGEDVDVPQDAKEKIADQFLGAYFGLASFILDLGIISADDLDFACKQALVINPPFIMMNESGTEKALGIVRQFCDDNPDFKIPSSLENAAKMGAWLISR